MFVSVKKAAELLAVHEQTIYNMVRSKRLNARKNINTWEIPIESIQEILDAKQNKHEKAIGLTQSLEVLEEYYNEKMGEALDELMQACQNANDSYHESLSLHNSKESSVAKAIAKTECFKEMSNRISALDKALQHYKKMEFVIVHLSEDLQKRIGQLMRDYDNDLDQQIDLLETRKKMMDEGKITIK